MDKKAYQAKLDQYYKTPGPSFDCNCKNKVEMSYLGEQPEATSTIDLYSFMTTGESVELEVDASSAITLIKGIASANKKNVKFKIQKLKSGFRHTFVFTNKGE